MIRDYIPNFNDYDDEIRSVVTSGYVLAINVRMLRPEVIETTYPVAWWDEYRKRMYVGVDPIARWCISSEGVKRWSEIGRDATFSLNNFVMRRAEKHGLKYGIAMAHGRPGEPRSFLTGSRPDREVNDDEIAILFDTFRKCTALIEKRQLLTQNELTALELTAQGFTQKEIAREMGKSPAYVKIQLNSAKKCLGATSTVHTVALAQQRGMIDVPGGMRW